MKTGDVAGARDDFEAVIRLEGKDSKSDLVAGAHVELAQLYNLAKENDAALAHCNAVLKVRPNLAPAYRQYAQVLLALEKHKEAGAALDQYVNLGGKPTVAVYRARGLIYRDQRDYPAAVFEYSLALKTGQPHLPALAAETVLSQAIPGLSSGMRQLLDLHVFALDRKERVAVLNERGRANLAQEAIRPALNDFDDALKLSPTDSDALVGRGLALVLRGRQGDVAEAISAAERSLGSGTKSPLQLLYCARIYARAAGLVEAMPRRPVYDGEVMSCQRRAAALLRETMESVSSKDRRAFWRNDVLTDPLLRPLLRLPLPDLRELHVKYGG
jgi:tetratricopeptide (TPR) repeat protein